jgi:hypothetical protein
VQRKTAFPEKKENIPMRVPNPKKQKEHIGQIQNQIHQIRRRYLHACCRSGPGEHIYNKNQIANKLKKKKKIHQA